MELEPEQGQPAEEPAPPEQRQLTIDLAEVDDDAHEDKTQAPQPEQKRARRQAVRELAAQKKELEHRFQTLQTEMAELRGRVSVPAPAANPGTAAGADPLDTELKNIEAQKDGLLTAIQALPQNDPRVPRLAELWQQLQDRRDDIRDEKKEAKKEAKRQRAPEHEEQRRQNIQLTLEAEFPQVYSDEELRLRAQAEFAGLRKRGKPDGLATAREACQRAMGKSGVGRPIPGPTDLERTRYSGIPARAGTQGGSAGQWVPNRFEISTARAFTKHMPDLSDEERVRMWAKMTGNMPRQAG